MIKLLTKTILYILTATIVLFSIGVFVIYKTIIFKLDSEANEHLLSTKNKTIAELRHGIPAENIFAKNDSKNQITKIEKQTIFSDRCFIETEKETYINTESEDEEESVTFKVLIFQTNINNTCYEVKITNSLAEGKEIGEYIMGVVTVFLIISSLILLIINLFISKHIWKPFNATITSLKKWEIKNSLNLGHTSIYEFNTLNSSLMELTEKIKLDYSNLKEFTENISHETQTPLTILSNKLELLLQEKTYTPEQANLIQESYMAVQRLYKLNKTLILLSRIENKQFLEMQFINLNLYINEKIEEYEDFFENKAITVHKQLEQNIDLEINTTLINVLFDNLLLNAIKYNIETGGTITIKLSNNVLCVENTSFINELEQKFLFERISKNSTSNSLGIGLSLIKKIADFYSWGVSYQYQNNLHRFFIHFKPKKKE